MNDFAKRMIGVHGERAIPWLESLQERVLRLSKRWNLELIEAIDEPAFNYLVYAKQGNCSSVVLKLGVPSKELECEIATLKHWAGQGAARIVEADEKEGALLLDCHRPQGSNWRKGLRAWSLAEEPPS